MVRKHPKPQLPTPSTAIPAEYPAMLADVKARIRAAQLRATLMASAELIHLYWDIGRTIASRQQQQGWGASVIPRLSRDIHNELPEVKGFSERNIGYMIRFAREYVEPPILQQPVAKLAPGASALATPTAAQPSVGLVPFLLPRLPWGHHITLMERVRDLPTRIWYMEQTLANGWSRNVLAVMIDSQAHTRQGKAVTNFDRLLPPPQSDLAQQALKDPYIFDFLTLEQPFHERELETSLLHHLEKFLVELGQGFASVGRQYHVEVGSDDFYIDLLFYHLRLRCFVVIDLKKGAFKAEYAGKMNFYCNVVDDRLRHPSDQPTIGLILCQERNRLVAEYALKGVSKSIGVSEYQFTRSLPVQFKSSLPTVQEIEAELSPSNRKSAPRRSRKTRKE